MRDVSLSRAASTSGGEDRAAPAILLVPRSVARGCVLHSAEKASSGPAGGVDPDLRESPGEITAPARKARDVGTQVGASRAFARMYAR